MMNKTFIYIILFVGLLSSCQEINIQSEVQHTALLDSVLQRHEKSYKKLNHTKIEHYIQKATSRSELFTSPQLSGFQKQWLHHDKELYSKIAADLTEIKLNVDSLEKEFEFSKNQLTSLKKDLVHRHISKEQFKLFFTDEQKAITKLVLTNQIIIEKSNHCFASFDSLEQKLFGVISQLNAMQAQ